MGLQWWRSLVEGTGELGQQIGITWNIMCISATRGGYAFSYTFACSLCEACMEYEYDNDIESLLDLNLS